MSTLNVKFPSKTAQQDADNSLYFVSQYGPPEKLVFKCITSNLNNQNKHVIKAYFTNSATTVKVQFLNTAWGPQANTVALQGFNDVMDGFGVQPELMPQDEPKLTLVLDKISDQWTRV